MLQELKFQLSTAILTVLTIAAAIAAVLNYQQNQRFRLPDDGVVWRDHSGVVVATRVIPNGPGEHAGIRVNDVLESIKGVQVRTTEDVSRILASGGAWTQASYVFRRAGIDVTANIVVAEVTRGVALNYQYLVGVCYLAIGMFIYFRRGSAYKARHFYVFCLVSFIFS